MSSTMSAPPASDLEPMRGPIGQHRNIKKQILLSVLTLNQSGVSKGAPAAV